jgi:hypothetical protein
MNDNNDTKVYLVFKDGFAMPKAFFESVKEQVLEIIPALTRGIAFTLEDLCGADFWGALSDGQRRLAGRCMVYMVRDGMLQLEFSGHICASPKRYQLK